MSYNCSEHWAKAVTDDDSETEEAGVTWPAGQSRAGGGCRNYKHINITHCPLLHSAPSHNLLLPWPLWDSESGESSMNRAAELAGDRWSHFLPRPFIKMAFISVFPPPLAFLGAVFFVTFINKQLPSFLSVRVWRPSICSGQKAPHGATSSFSFRCCLTGTFRGE